MLRIGEGFEGERSLVLPAIVRHAAQDDAVLRQLHITDMGHYPHAMHHYRERTTPIGQHILIHCTCGSGWYRVGGTQHEVHADQYFIIPAGHPHTYASNNDDPWTIYWIHFAGDLAAELAGDCQGPRDVRPGPTSRIADRIMLFEEIFLTLSDGYSTDNLRYAAALLHAYLATFRFLPLFRKYHKQGDRVAEGDVIQAAIKYMGENIEKRLSLPSLARYIGYSVSQFSLIFKNNTGHSPLNYFNLMKVQEACRLLETTDMKIVQISGKVGIDDNYYFSRLFSKVVGISPRQYRQSVREAAERSGGPEQAATCMP